METWITCPTCGGDGIEYAWPDDAAADTHLCPDCSDGLVPSDGEIEAAAVAMSRVASGPGLGINADTWLALARASLVAARRYQRKAEER